MIHPLQQHLHVRQIEFMRRGLRQFVSQRQQPVNRGLVEGGFQLLALAVSSLDPGWRLFLISDYQTGWDVGH